MTELQKALNRVDSFTYRDSQQAFTDAIKAGRLTETESDPNFAGKYMYMHTDANGRDAFKNIMTRSYDI